jgi:hypothetical protein
MAKLRPNQFYLPCGALITELPILFQTQMVQAILSGRKTKTRRSTTALEAYDKSHAPHEFVRDEFREDHWDFFSVSCFAWGQVENPNIKSAYGKPGDLLWVKETWKKADFPESDGPFEYRASLENPNALWNKGIWKPSIHMPKTASRIWLMIEDIRVERLQDISEEDAIAEGIERWVETRMKSQPMHYKVYTDSDPEALYTSSPKDSFETLWISINGEESWNANPWVWVIQYRILSKTGRPSMDVIEKNYLEVTEKEVANA